MTVCAFHRFCHSWCSAFAGLILKQSTGYYSASDSMCLTPLLPFSVLCLYGMHSKYITQIQQQRPELPTVTLTGMRIISINTRYINSTRYSHLAYVYCTSGGVYVPCISMHARPLVEFTYLVFICMPGESYCRQLRSLLYLGLYCTWVFQVLINSLVG